MSMLTKPAYVPGYGHLEVHVIGCDECGKEALIDKPSDLDGWVDTFIADPEGGQFCGEVCRQTHYAKREREKVER